MADITAPDLPEFSDRKFLASFGKEGSADATAAPSLNQSPGLELFDCILDVAVIGRANEIHSILDHIRDCASCLDELRDLRISSNPSAE